MIHFFAKYGDARNSPFAHELQKLNVPARIFSGLLRFHFRSRILIPVIGYPKLLMFSVRSAINSLVLSTPSPSLVVLDSDIEIFVFSAFRFLMLRKMFGIVYIGFIYTGRGAPWYEKLRHRYYSLVLRNCACIICHSRLETERYSRLFPQLSNRFAFVAWGSDVHGWRDIPIENAEHHRGRPFWVLAAGRSGRDYPTFAAAVASETVEATIVCDNREALAGVVETANLRILRSCYALDFLAQLSRCDAVVVPLAVEDISAGQMVIIQALAYAKPIIATQTPTIENYLTDEVDALTVPRGDPVALRDAIRRLRDDPELYTRLCQRARHTYEERFSQAAYTRRLATVLQRLKPGAPETR